MTPKNTHFSARELAAAAGLSKRAVNKALRGLQPAECKSSPFGPPANCWAVDMLPESLRRRLVNVANQHGYETVEDLLSQVQPAQTATRSSDVTTMGSHDPALQSLIDGVSSRQPHILWHHVFIYWEALLAADQCNGGLKSAVLTCLASNFPGLAPGIEALRRSFDRKFQSWMENGRTAGILKDKRVGLKPKSKSLCPACAGLYQKSLVTFRADEAHAWRESYPEFCEACRERHSYDIREYKSRVPHSVRREFGPLTEAAVKFHRSPKSVRTEIPFIPQDPFRYTPGDVFSGDDVTPEIWSYIQLPTGEFIVGRWQLLISFDKASGCPLSYRHIPSASFSAVDVQLMTKKTVLNYGLPRNGFSYEKGTFGARIIAGERQGRWEWRSLEHTELGLCEKLGLSLHQPNGPTGKPRVENGIGIIQRMMRGEPGWAGNNERFTMPEALEDFLRKVRAGKASPVGVLWSFEQWHKRIGEILDKFANEPQNTEALPGISPIEAWAKSVNSHPLKPLPEELHYLLQTHECKKRVTIKKAITISRHMKRPLVYADENTGRFINQDVRVYRDLEHPELIYFSDMAQSEFHCVKEVGNMEKTEGLAAAKRACHAHIGPAKALAATVPVPVATIGRDSDYSKAEKEVGRSLIRKRKEYQDEQRAAQEAENVRARTGQTLFAEGREEYLRENPEARV